MDINRISYNPTETKISVFSDPGKVMKLFTKFRSLLDSRQSYLNDTDFTNITTAEELEEIRQKLETKKAAYEQHGSEDLKLRKLFSDLCEEFLAKIFMDSCWFGENINCYLSSEEDDVFSGIDLVFTNTEENETILFGVDFTYTYNSQIINKKINYLKRCVEKNRLHVVKFLKNEEGKIIKRNKVPKIVLGVSDRTIYNLMQSYLDPENKDRKNKLMAETDIKYLFLVEALYQLIFFYSQIKGESIYKPKLANIYDKLIPIYLEEKDRIKIIIETYIEKDPTFKNILTIAGYNEDKNLPLTLYENPSY